jgi:hypothetical protein
MLAWLERERGYRPTWAAINYKEKFGEWPKPFGYKPKPVEPSPEVRSWVQSRLIAYAKRKQGEQ